tara:strand:- start:32 stop:640 length:609 start_codon:yes stop_codon:yes gene_type:complete
MDATAKEHYPFIWCILVFASAGVLSHSGIKVPFFTFFAHDSGLRPKEAPLNMILAMGFTAFLCVFLGVFPQYLYTLLPFEVNYVPYTISHVLSQMQLLCFALLAFTVIMKLGLHPPEVNAINLDTDWVYRKFCPSFLDWLGKKFSNGYSSYTKFSENGVELLQTKATELFGPTASFSRVVANGIMVIWIIVIFSGTLIIALF